MKRAVFWLLLLVFPALVAAKTATDLAEDPVVEQRLIRIAEELRCLVCQNESLAGSRAELANDLRREVRSLIKSGRSDDEIKAFLVSRYGDFVLYRPPLKPLTWLLWFGPAVLLFMALGVLFTVVRRSRRSSQEAPISQQRKAQAQALLNESSDGP